MSRIFISYRREDTGMGVGRLADALRQHFDREQVFQDISSIDPGADFIEALQKALADCAAVLVVIGPRWLTVTGRQGKRRLDDPHDWVRQEIVEALGRPGLKVFPLLVDGADMPSAEDLPEPLQPLARRQAYELTLRHWAKDVDVLTAMLKLIPALDDGLIEQRRRAAEEKAQSEAEATRVAGERARQIRAEEQRRAELEARRRAEEEQRRIEAEAKHRAEEERQRKEAEAAREVEEARRRAKEVAKAEAAEPNSATAQSTVTTPSLPWKPLAAGGLVIAVIGFFALRSGKEPPAKPAAADSTPTAVTVPASTRSPQVGETFRDCDECPEMVVVPSGNFIMGSPSDEKGRDDDEGPQHPVKFARPFAVGKYEVTFQEWDACVAAKGCNHRPNDYGWGKGRQPVVDVGWKDASEYSSWLTTKTGKSYRLLSEAEWEYAARGGKTTRYPWGNEPGTNRANFNGSGSQWTNKQAAPVGSFAANAFGLHDMIGNVWEWTRDCWNDSYQGAPGDGSAWESDDCGRRVVRGGSWVFGPVTARSAVRGGFGPYFRNNNLGFRLARTL